jgi:hypothetical protein
MVSIPHAGTPKAAHAKQKGRVLVAEKVTQNAKR